MERKLTEEYSASERNDRSIASPETSKRRDYEMGGVSEGAGLRPWLAKALTGLFAISACGQIVYMCVSTMTLSKHGQYQ